MTNLRERCENLCKEYYRRRTETTYDLLRGLIEAFARECERDGYRKGVEDSAKLMEDKFHKVGRYPNYHPKYVPGDTYSPFAEAIRALLSKGEG